MSFFTIRQRLAYRSLSSLTIPQWKPSHPIMQTSRCLKSTSQSPVGKGPIHQTPKLSRTKNGVPLPYRKPSAKPSAKPSPLSRTQQEITLSQAEMKQEEMVQQSIVKNRQKLLGPGLFAVSAVLGIYAAFAYLDTRCDARDKDLVPRTPLAGWYLTPTIIVEGAKAGWRELDKMTIGLIGLYIGIQLMRRSPIKFWEKLPHIAGERKYTLVTYPFVHSSWVHLGSGAFILCWLMPSIVRYFDGDYLHAAALYLSVPVLTGFLTHLQFRGGRVMGIPIEMGPSGVLAALIGAFAVIHPHEQLWAPFLGPFRAESRYAVLALFAWELLSMWASRRMSMRAISHSSHVVGMSLGAAYVYFDAKTNIWEPLTRLFAREKPVEGEEVEEGREAADGKTAGQTEGKTAVETAATKK